jgi:hypothetical protein
MRSTYEDRPEKDTPLRVREALAEYGGHAPDGRPLWRLIFALNRRVRIAGVMTTMPKGVVPEDTDPLRTEEGVFWYARYGDVGWVLERWFPGYIWGTETEWNQERHGADGRTRMKAVYPRNGDYFFMGGPWRQMPAIEELKVAIRAQIRDEQTRPVNWGSYLRAEMIREELKLERDAVECEEHFAALGRQTVDPLMGSTSRAAQRLRNGLAVGIGGEDWYLGVA